MKEQKLIYSKLFLSGIKIYNFIYRNFLEILDKRCSKNKTTNSTENQST